MTWATVAAAVVALDLGFALGAWWAGGRRR
jgi:hypothetical protein